MHFARLVSTSNPITLYSKPSSNTHRTLQPAAPSVLSSLRIRSALLARELPLFHHFQLFPLPSSPIEFIFRMHSIPITTDSAASWDWPLQHNDGVVKVTNTSEKFEVGLDAGFFGPNDIDVKVNGYEIIIHLRHSVGFLKCLFSITRCFPGSSD